MMTSILTTVSDQKLARLLTSARASIRLHEISPCHCGCLETAQRIEQEVLREQAARRKAALKRAAGGPVRVPAGPAQQRAASGRRTRR